MNDKTFIKIYNYAKKYYEKYGDLLVPKNYVIDNVKLGTRIAALRMHYKNNTLTPNQIKLLEDIGMIWNVHDYINDSHLKVIDEYYKEHGTINIVYPKNELEKNIQSWINIWRHKNNINNLSEKIYNALSKYDISWNNNLNKNRNKNEEFYQKALFYYEKYGTLFITKEEDFHDAWFRRMLYHYADSYRNNKLDYNFAKKLDYLGMPWNIVEINNYFKRMDEKQAMSYISAVCRVVNKINRFPLISEIEKISKKFAKWYKYMIYYGHLGASPKIKELWNSLNLNLKTYHELEESFLNKGNKKL